MEEHDNAITDGMRTIVEASAKETGIYTEDLDFDGEIAKYRALMAVAARNNDIAGHLMYLGLLIWISVANGKDEKFLDVFYEASPFMKEDRLNNIGISGAWDVIGAFLNAGTDHKKGEEYARQKIISIYDINEMISMACVSATIKTDLIDTLGKIGLFGIGKKSQTTKDKNKEVGEELKAFWLTHLRAGHADHDPENCSAEASILAADPESVNLIGVVVHDLLMQIQLGNVNNLLWGDFGRMMKDIGVDLPGFDFSDIIDDDPSEQLSEDSQDFLEKLMKDFK